MYVASRNGNRNTAARPKQVLLVDDLGRAFSNETLFVGCHHQPMQLPEADRMLPAIVHVADVLAARIGAGYTRTVETEVVDSEVLSLLDLGEPDMESLAETLPETIEETQQLLADSGSR